MKTFKLKYFGYPLLMIGMVFLLIISCQKENEKDEASPDIAVALENDKDALMMMELIQQNSDDVINALRKENISIEEFKILYESGDEARIAETLKLDPTVLLQRNNQIQELAMKVNARYPDLESYTDDGQVYEDPFVTMGLVLESDGAVSSKGKCSGWRNWRNLAKYTVCVAACATSTAGIGYVLCTAVCYFSFCT